MIHMFSNFSYSSTKLDFVYICLPLFTFVQLTHLCTNFVLVYLPHKFEFVVNLKSSRKCITQFFLMKNSLFLYFPFLSLSDTYSLWLPPWLQIEIVIVHFCIFIFFSTGDYFSENWHEWQCYRRCIFSPYFK